MLAWVVSMGQIATSLCESAVAEAGDQTSGGAGQSIRFEVRVAATRAR